MPVPPPALTRRRHRLPPARRRAPVVGRNGPGEILGVASLLLGVVPGARVVCDQPSTEIVWLPKAWLGEFFERSPSVASKFYYFLGRRQAHKLRSVTEQLETSGPELVMHDDVEVPGSMAAIAENEAFLSIFHKYVRSLPSETLDIVDPLVRFLYDVRALRREAMLPAVRALAASMQATYAAPDAARTLFGALPTGERTADERRDYQRRHRAAIDECIGRSKPGAPPGAEGRKTSVAVGIRHAFDSLETDVLDALEAHCLKGFMTSMYYEYVLALKMKEREKISFDHLRVVRSLGEGSFGQVVEVVKRDCGKHYALKVMDKQHMIDEQGDEAWQDPVLTERSLLASLHHPLMINLAYAFQNMRYLVFVMDVCYGGDLDDFGSFGDARLSQAQLHFVGVELVSVIAHLHSRRVLFRDLKPANVMLDDEGHIRLIDFGLSKQSPDGPDGKRHPWSTERVGTWAYMAPEVHKGKRYCYSCDWFSVGVLLYELAEKDVPFGEEPEYETNFAAEYAQPALRAADGTSEVPHLRLLLERLLHWDPDRRLSSEADVCAHPYWSGGGAAAAGAGDDDGSEDAAVDWELAAHRRLPSPLKQVVTERIAARQRKWADESFASAGKLPKAVTQLVNDFNASQQQQRLIEQRRQELEETEGGGENVREALLERDDSMRVEGWEFVSEHAVVQEYIEMAASVVTVV